MIDRHRARGPLAAVAHVRVYADGAEPYVTFSGECTLGPDAAREEVAAVVEQARAALAGWR